MKKYEKSRENFVIQRRVEAGKVEDVNSSIFRIGNSYRIWSTRLSMEQG